MFLTLINVIFDLCNNRFIAKAGIIFFKFRYSFHRVKFTPVSLQFCKSYQMYSLETITTILILKSSITLQIPMYRLVIDLFPQALGTNDFFSFPIILPSPQCYINGIRQYVAFGVWLLSYSIIHLTFIGVAFVSSSFLFITEKYFIVWIVYLPIPQLRDVYFQFCVIISIVTSLCLYCFGKTSKDGERSTLCMCGSGGREVLVQRSY